MSVIYPPANLGPEMAAPILWAPGILWFFQLENPHAHKSPPFMGAGGGVGVGVSWKGGGGSANFIFMGEGIFPIEGCVVFVCESLLTLTLQSLLFFDFLVFFSDFLAFLGRFTFLSKDFRLSAKRKTLVFLGGGGGP